MRRTLALAAALGLPACGADDGSGADGSTGASGGASTTSGTVTGMPTSSVSGTHSEGTAADASTDTGAPPGSTGTEACGDVSVCEVDGCCGSTCGYEDDLECLACDGSLGLVDPLLPCTEARPCDSLLASYGIDGVQVLTDPVSAATCQTTEDGLRSGHPDFEDPILMEWVDQDGLTRQACRYDPPGAAPSSTRPVLVFIHGSGGSSTSVYDLTRLRAKAPAYDLSGDAARPGFILLAPQGRNLHWPTQVAQDGSKHDTFHRDLDAPSSNRDIAFIDELIDALVAEGVADPDRIYVGGWSNGMRFAALYGIARHGTPSPGGNQVAAVAGYSGGDPFSDAWEGLDPSCAAEPRPTSSLPLMLVSRVCDAIACDEAQAQGFADAGAPVSPGNVAETWIQTLTDTIGSDATWVRLTGVGAEVEYCNGPAACSPELGLINHVRWPDGTGADTDAEPRMLDFLRAHPL